MGLNSPIRRPESGFAKPGRSVDDDGMRDSVTGTLLPRFEQGGQFGIAAHEGRAAKFGPVSGGGGHCIGESPGSLLSDAVGQRRSLQVWLGSQIG